MPGPFDSWLVLRGLKTLALRMQRHCENARAVAEFLDGHPGVERVLYPGLPGHPGHELAARQMADFGGMVSFLAGSAEEAAAIVSRTKIWKLAESLGGVESLIEVPAAMTHASTADAPFACPPSLVRLSVGIESADDLVADLESALVRSAAPDARPPVPPPAIAEGHAWPGGATIENCRPRSGRSAVRRVDRPDLIDLHHLTERVVGAYLLETDDGLALFDCGPASCLEALEAGLDERGVALTDIRHLLLSHIHLDHAGAAGTLVREAPGAPGPRLGDRCSARRRPEPARTQRAAAVRRRLRLALG